MREGRNVDFETVGLVMIFVIVFVLLHHIFIITNKIEVYRTTNEIKANNIEQKVEELSNKIDKISSSIEDVKKQVNYLIKQENKTKKLSLFIKEVNPYLPNHLVKVISKTIIQSSNKYSVPVEVILAVAWQESHFKVNVVSSAGCIGIMQINPEVWTKKLNIPEEVLWYPQINIEVGTYILRYYYEKEGSWEKAIERYYGKDWFGKKYRKMVLRKIRKVRDIIKDIS